MATPDVHTEELVLCTYCDDSVPRSHTVVREGVGRICWFCHEDERVDPDTDWDDDDLESLEYDYADYDDWD